MKRASIAFSVLFVFLFSCNQEETAGSAELTSESVASTGPQSPAETDEFAEVREQVDRANAEEKGSARQILMEKKVTADAQLDRAWGEFRRAYPYHIQEIAMSRASNGTRTVIVAEPPPNVSLDDVLFAAGPNLVAYEVKKQPVGYDGWVKDIVIKISGDDAAASSVASRLTTALFQTSYKAHILPLPAKPRHVSLDLDLNVTPAEIQKWIFTDRETFIPVFGGEARLANEVFASTTSTVYFSGRRGLVGWWIPRGAHIDSMAVEARQFALDSDLIIGAIACPAGVLVLARERAVDVDDLPPLRFETIALFAAVTGSAREQLEQSYERNAKFAGAISRGRDWAPIHLSPELVDTEYGSLLNITDQLLKGWSNAGETRYVNFSYPRPRSFPFSAPLPQVLDTGGALTYNWNTTGVGYTVADGDRDIFALYRTGALPTSYIPEGMKRTDPAVLNAEDTGYQYFASLDDPNLVRVVQYAALYQIFTTFNITGNSVFLQSNDFPKTTRSLLEREMSGELEHMSGSELDALSAKLALTIASNMAVRVPGRFQPKSFAKKIGPDVRHELELVQLDMPPPSSSARAIRELSLSAFAEMHKMPERFAQVVGDKANESDKWIHTPVVVISENRGEIQGGVGGHNLYAAVTRFEIANDVQKGVPVVTREGRLRIHPADEAKAHELLRIAARDAKNKMSAEDIAADLRNAMRHIRDDIEIREPLKALKLAEGGGHIGKPPKPPFRGRGPADHGGGGWGMNFSSPPPSDRGAVLGALLIERREDRTIRIVFSDNREAHASNAEDATDAVVQILKRGDVGDGSVRMIMRGFDENDGRSFVESCNLRSKTADREISALIEQRRIDSTAAAEILGRKYDWGGVKINEIPLEIRDGRPHSTLVFDIPRENGAARADLTLAFHKATPEPVARTLVSRIKDSIRRILQEKKAELNAFVFNWRVNAEVKALSRKTGVPIEVVRHQFVDAQRDFVFVDLSTYGFFREIDEPRRRPA